MNSYGIMTKNNNVEYQNYISLCAVWTKKLTDFSWSWTKRKRRSSISSLWRETVCRINHDTIKVFLVPYMQVLWLSKKHVLSAVLLTQRLITLSLQSLKYKRQVQFSENLLCIIRYFVKVRNNKYIQQ